MAKPTLDNFEQTTPSDILQRGRDYYDGGCIAELEEMDDGSLVADVTGSDDYTVRVWLENRHICDYDCDCPYDGDPCKHAVAVWYALRAKLEDAKKGGRTKKTKRQSFDGLLREVTLEELQGFLNDYASRDEDFRTDFELYFSDKGGVDVQNRYAEVIRKTIQKHSDRGFIDYRASGRLASDIDKVIAAGTDYVNKRNYRDAFLLVKATLLPTVEAMGYADDSSAHISGCIQDIVQLLADLVSAPETPRPLLADIFEHLLVELTNTEYFSYGDFGWELFAAMEDAALKLGETDSFIEFIDRKLDTLTGQYDRTQLIRSKIFVFEQLGSMQEAESLVTKHLSIFEKDIPAARPEVLAVAQRLKDAYSVKPRRPAM